MDIDLWKKRKKQKKISYDELSLIAKIPRRTIVSIFSGETQAPRIDTVQAIEKALGLDDDGITVIKHNELTETETRLLTAFNALIPPMQEYVLEMVEKLTETERNIKRA